VSDNRLVKLVFADLVDFSIVRRWASTVVDVDSGIAVEGDGRRILMVFESLLLLEGSEVARPVNEIVEGDTLIILEGLRKMSLMVVESGDRCRVS